MIYAVNLAASAGFQTLKTDVSSCIICINLNLSALSLTFSPPHQSHNPQREPPIENEWEASARLRTSGHMSLVRSLSGSKNSFISFSPFKTDPARVLKETAFNIIHCFHPLLFCAHEIFIQYRVSVGAGEIWRSLVILRWIDRPVVRRMFSACGERPESHPQSFVTY